MKRLNKKDQLLILFLVVGFFVGIVYENLIAKDQGVSIHIFQSYFLKQYSTLKIVSEDYLWYIMQIRVFSLLILCILGCLKWKKILVAFWLVWTGCLGGILTVASVMQLGVKGMLLCIAGFFPHMICYGAAYWMLLGYLYQYPKKQWNAVKTVFVIVAVFLGILLETYINPFIVKWVISLTA